MEGRGMRIRRDPSSTGEVARAHVEGTERANGGPPHIHLLQEERFIVHTGALNVRHGRDRIRVGAGEEIRIPPKVVHTFQAETETSYTVEFRPALGVWEFFRDLFALPTDRRGNPRIGDAARLMRAYPDEFLYFPLVPVPVQRALAVPLSKLRTARR
jgi:mannose-6-phosphate isomerase-like protein (cupin superfamily)